MTAKNKWFNTMLLEAIDESLQSILGESGKTVIYYYLENSYGLRKENIPENPEAFTEFLNKLFGVGSKLIENTILKKLCQKFEINPEQAENITIPDFLRKIRQRKV